MFSILYICDKKPYIGFAVISDLYACCYSLYYICMYMMYFAITHIRLFIFPKMLQLAYYLRKLLFVPMNLIVIEIHMFTQQIFKIKT